MITTFRRYDEAVIAAKVCHDANIAKNWRDYANQMLLRLLDEVVEIEAAESRPAAWATKNPWDHKAIDRNRWRIFNIGIKGKARH